MLKITRRKIRYSLQVLARIYGWGEIEKQCPCCGFSGRFDCYGHPPRYGSRCPNCGSLERHRLLMLADRTADLFSDKEVLHFAPEKVIAQMISQRAHRYTSADLMPGRADRLLNIERIEERDESWDVVVCLHVLEHVQDKHALGELHRILRQDAKLVAMVPIVEGWEETYENDAIISESERQLHFGQSDHVRIYGRNFRDRLQQAGFEVEEFHADAADTVKYGLFRGEKVFICTKS